MKQTSTKELVKIITASSVGTLIEWYDFFVFRSLSNFHFSPYAFLANMLWRGSMMSEVFNQ